MIWLKVVFICMPHPLHWWWIWFSPQLLRICLLLEWSWFLVRLLYVYIYWGQYHYIRLSACSCFDGYPLRPVLFSLSIWPDLALIELSSTPGFSFVNDDLSAPKILECKHCLRHAIRQFDVLKGWYRCVRHMSRFLHLIGGSFPSS